MEMESPKLRRLTCSVKNYDWGCKGGGSQVARLAALNSWTHIDPEMLYAEFWMGTHESGPSFVEQAKGEKGVSENSPGVTLRSWEIPVSLAIRLWRSADDNHKPEMALAITKYEALCGFVSMEELKDVLQNVPEIVELVGIADVEQFLSLNEKDNGKAKSTLESIFTQLIEALYLGANEPHAYLSGQCIECMATSDNVVRAGLTPKYRDVQKLCSMLTYKQGSSEILRGVPLNTYTKKYLPPFDEFEVDSCLLPKETSAVFLAALGPSIFLFTVVKGKISVRSSAEGVSVNEGDVIFVPANTEISLKSETELQAYRTGVSGRFFKPWWIDYISYICKP
ncbi:hypothetical protein CDL15_Pgr008529 [Punica granatum]|uniref:Phosphomannose isomerase type I catalytic domain-containing protein n=1 Tax=Punica granatum TaxID=22663 RepID=A0A218WNJ4_PUNGR|nr:hypothetical protein CDL15_Pgr008529 [Punica granatum]